jgi:DNA-binding transcriptional ArsR family regulator
VNHDAHVREVVTRSVPVSTKAGEHGVVGWMLRVCQVVASRHRLAILLALAESDTPAQPLQGLVARSRSSVYRHLQALRAAGLVVDQVAGFGQGPPSVFALTLAGRQLVEALRGVAQQVLGATPLRPDRSPVAPIPAMTPRVGLVKVDRGALIGLLELASDYHHWRLLHGLLDEDAFVVAVRRLHQLAQAADIDFAAVQERTRRGGDRSGGARR